MNQENSTSHTDLSSFCSAENVIAENVLYLDSVCVALCHWNLFPSICMILCIPLLWLCSAMIDGRDEILSLNLGMLHNPKYRMIIWVKMHMHTLLELSHPNDRTAAIQKLYTCL